LDNRWQRGVREAISRTLKNNAELALGTLAQEPALLLYAWMGEPGVLNDQKMVFSRKKKS